MDSENSADHVFVDIDAEGQSDLLGNALAASRAIAAFHFNDRVDQLFGRAFGTRPADPFE
jgi:hypothetical protein